MHTILVKNFETEEEADKFKALCENAPARHPNENFEVQQWDDEE